MAKDATMEILADLSKGGEEIFSHMNVQEYNIEDMDPKACMASLLFSGCYVFTSKIDIDPENAGLFYVDGEEAEGPVLVQDGLFGQMVGFRARKFLLDYGKTYKILFKDAKDMEGNQLPDFEFELKTNERKMPGKVWPDHDKVVLMAAEESAVLLKNDNTVLPLGPDAVVNPIGSGVVVYRSGCLGAGKTNPRYFIRIKEGIEEYSSLNLNDELYNFYRDEKDVIAPSDIIDRAKKLNNTAVIFISRTSSEAHDNKPEKGSYYLTDDEMQMIKDTVAAFDKTVAVLNVAHPIEMKWVDELGVDAVLLTGLAGMAGGAALAEILEGKVNPSGKLPNSWAYDYYDYITSANFITDCQFSGPFAKACATTVYEEGLYMGYRYFDSFDKEVAYAFGHGLSYTSFSKEVISATTKDLCTSINVKVTNTGDRAGKEVVQIYASISGEKLEQPKRRLVAFAKTKLLEAGECEELTLVIDENRISSYDEAAAEWVVEAGEINFLLGDENVYCMTVSEKKVIKKAGGRVPCPIEITELSQKDPKASWPKGELTKVYEQEELPYEKGRDDVFEEVELNAETSEKYTFDDLKKNPEKISEFVAGLTNAELARFCVGRKTGWGYGESGYAGMFYNCGILEKYEIPQYIYSDGNNGVNLMEPNIGFPVSSTMCASWNEELMYEEGKAIAEESLGFDMQCVLAPALNLQRNPLCGRHAEYFSEDPLLAGRMAGQQCRGLEENGTSGSMKHFFANNAETLRNSNHSIMSERVARELYIKAFEFAFEVKMPDTVMTGYNAANGLYCSNDVSLIKGILREEMGFEGYVMTDWGGFGNKGPEGLMAAGISWIAPGSEDDSFTGPIEKAMEEGRLSRAAMQENVCRLLRILVKTSLNEK